MQYAIFKHTLYDQYIYIYTVHDVGIALRLAKRHISAQDSSEKSNLWHRLVR